METVSKTRIYFVVEASADPQAVERLVAAVDAAALLVVPGPGAALDARACRPLVERAQAKGIAALIADDAELARALRADGVHLRWEEDIIARYGEARDILGRRFVVGADAGRSRHDAMTLGEAGADYVAFGIPARVEDRAAARARRLDLIGWWGEIFEVPCVAFDVETAEEARALAEAGADFVALSVPTKLSADELARWSEELVRALTVPEAAA
jgi:thiamine-phosphate pyrophosphorylase